MGPVLLGRSHGHDQRRPQLQSLAHCDRGHLFQTPGALLLSHRARSWVAGVLAVVGAAAEWLRHPSPLWVWVGWACVAAGAAALYPLAGWRPPGPTPAAPGPAPPPAPAAR